MKIVITGGMGFIGSSLINKLDLDMNEVFIIDDFSTKVNKTISGCELINIDLSDKNQLHDINIGSADIMIHLAGPSSGPASAKDPEGTIDISNKITFNVLRICEQLSIKRLVFTSSMAVYGNPSKLPVDEKSICEPISYYGIAKLSSEHIIQAFCKSSNLEYSIVRLFNIYGPGQDLTRMDQGLVSIYLSMLLNDKSFVIKGKLDRVRDLIHIDDVINSMITVMFSNAGVNQIINVCNGSPVTIDELAKLLIKYFENYSYNNIIQKKESFGDTFKIYGNNDKLLNIIEYKPKYDIETGVKDFVSWANNQIN